MVSMADDSLSYTSQSIGSKMKHQQVVVDYWTMFKTSGMCLLLAISGYIFLKMVQTIFWLPNHLKQNQLRLEAIAKQYGKDLDPEERAEIEKIFKTDGPLTEEQLNQLLENVKDDPEPKKALQPEEKKEK